jgi:putative ABC transport system ATP-binding protein
MSPGWAGAHRARPSPPAADDGCLCAGDPPAVELRRVTKQYAAAAGPVAVLAGVDLVVGRGEAVAVQGVSGSGKSTLLHILGAIERPTGGTVHVCGEDLGALGAREQAGFRARQIGFVFQFFNLLPTLTAAENVIAGLEPLAGTRALRRDAAAAALEAVGLAHLGDRYPAQLSGGEQQRVAIARAVAKRPALLLADEPTGALDAATAAQILEVLDAVRRLHGCSVVVATHDPAVVRHVDRVLRLERGLLGPGDR